LLEWFPDGQPLTDGFKKYSQLLTLLPKDMLVSRLDQKAELIKTSKNKKELEKIHYEVCLITNELNERSMI